MNKDLFISHITDRLTGATRLSEIASNNLNKTPFWKFRLRKRFRREYAHYRDQSGLLEIILNEIKRGDYDK